MTAIRTFKIFISTPLLLALAACGNDDDPMAGSGGGSATPQAVELENLSGTWFGAFDDNEESVVSFRFDIDGSQITNFMLKGREDEGIQASILERADEIQGSRVFRFETTAGPFVVPGILIVDPSATYMVFVHSNRQVGVLQKGEDSLPVDGYAAADIAGDWEGITVTARTVEEEETHLSPVEQTDSSATCTTDSESAPATSECEITVEDATRSASGLTLDNEDLGRWSGTFEDNGAARILLSVDKSFAGVWACTDPDGGFPGTCDFSAWTRGDAGAQ